MRARITAAKMNSDSDDDVVVIVNETVDPREEKRGDLVHEKCEKCGDENVLNDRKECYKCEIRRLEEEENRTCWIGALERGPRCHLDLFLDPEKMRDVVDALEQEPNTSTG